VIRTAFIKSAALACALIAGLGLAGCGKKNGTSPAASVYVKRPDALTWNMKTLVDVYTHGPNTSSLWDARVKRALTEYARARARSKDTDPNWREIVATNVAVAIDVGCTDPMVKYLNLRFSPDADDSKEARADAWSETALEMEQSGYPDTRKFYAAYNAVNQFVEAYNHPTNAAPEQIQTLIGYMFSNLAAMLEDKFLPPEEIYDACHVEVEMYSGDNTPLLQLYQRIEEPLFRNWPDAATSYLLKGEVHYDLAWLARGSGYANEVTAGGWQDFTNHLAVAEEATQKAWQLDPKDPKIPTFMLKIDEGLQKDRDDMEQWFQRAMALAPNNYDACKYKLHYLYPQWYGSREAMIAFGRECVAATNWGGDVPLILVDAHSDYNSFSSDSNEVKQVYWKQPGVWPDIRAAYERYFQVNPGAVDVYGNYAWYAYAAGQWDDFLNLTPKVRPADYGVFGGKDAFDKMVETARAESVKPH
jgi:hypothetical protein